MIVREDLKKDIIWGSLNQIADLFGRDKSVISRHIKDIFKFNELQLNSTVAKIATTAKENKMVIFTMESKTMEEPLLNMPNSPTGNIYHCKNLPLGVFPSPIIDQRPLF